MKQVSGEVKGFGGLIEKNSAQIKKMGRQMTLIGGAIVGTIGLMVKSFGTFDEAMTRSLAIMGKVSPAMRTEMAKTAKQLSTETTFAAKDLAEAYFFLASAGMSAEASVSALAPVARFAQAGTFDLAQATDLLTDAQTALGLSSTDVAKNEENLIRVSDVLVGANTLANASVLQFSESLTTKAAAALVNVNKEVEEGVAVLAAYADKGVKGRLAGTRLTMMLNGLFAATRENKKAWDEAGISLFKADGSMRSIADIIADMEGYLGSMTVKQREATLATLGFNVRTKDSILTLMGSSEKIKEWTKKLKEMGGITEEVSDKQLEAFNAQLTLAKNTIMGAAISIGKSLAPMIIKLIARIKTVAERISAWIDKHPKLTGAIVKLALGIGALLTVFGPLMMMLPGIIAALPLLKAGFMALLTPIAAVAAAALATGIAINALINIYKKKQDAEIAAIIKAATPMAKAMALRKKLIADEVISIEEWREIFNKHGRSYKRMLRAISTLPEYAHIKKAWDEVIKEHKEAGKSSGDLTGVLRKNSEEVVSLTSKMVDEIKRATLDEFEYRVWAAQRTYEERKALLVKENAEKQTFVLLDKALAVELNQIEKDRTKKFKEGWEERGRAVTAALLKWEAEQKKYQSFIAKYTDIVKKLTLGETQYKLWQLGKWFDTEEQTLWDLYGETKRYYDAKTALDEAYAAKRGAIVEAAAEDEKDAWKRSFRGALGDAAFFTSSLSGLFNQMAENQMVNIENEYEARRKAIEASLMSEASKTKAMERLDSEFEKKRKKAMRAQAARTKVVGIMEAIIHTASAVIEALPNIPLAIAVGIMGAAQTALIAAQALPSFQRGGRIEEGGIVGERGPELFVPERPGMIVPLRERGAAFLRPITITIAPVMQISAIDSYDVDRFMREKGLPATIEALKLGILKPELQEALGTK